MTNRCHECCHATLIENGTYKYYKCDIMEIIRNNRISSGYEQLDGCECFIQKSNTIFENIFD